MTEINKIYDDLIDPEDGQTNSENELFKELLEFERLREIEGSPKKNRIIEFKEVGTNLEYQPISVLKFAADSEVQDEKTNEKKSKFLVSPDEQYIMKYTRLVNNDLHIVLLAKPGVKTDEMIMYSKELDKYFISNSESEFVIGQYGAFDINLLNFIAVQPLDKILIKNENNSFVLVSNHGFSNPEIQGDNDTHILINPNTEKTLLAAALHSDMARELLKTENGIISIPRIILSDKSSLFIY